MTMTPTRIGKPENPPFIPRTIDLRDLLGGRAPTRRLHPLTSHELGARFELPKAIERGLLPSIFFSDDPQADLDAYTGTYLQQ